MNWLVEQCLRNEGFWVASSLLSLGLFLFDERSWHGLAKSGYQFELQRYRTRIVTLAILCTFLPLAAVQFSGLAGKIGVTAASVAVFHVYQKLAYEFSGISRSGASKRILLGLLIGLVIASMVFVKATFVPLIFVTAGSVISLSSRNHLFFKLSQETAALRERLHSEQAARHNHHFFVPATAYTHSSDDIAPKAG